MGHEELQFPVTYTGFKGVLRVLSSQLFSIKEMLTPSVKNTGLGIYTWSISHQRNSTVMTDTYFWQILI